MTRSSAKGSEGGYYAMPGIGELRGIFVSAGWSLSEHEGADGDRVITLEIPEAVFVEYEHVEGGRPTEKR